MKQQSFILNIVLAAAVILVLACARMPAFSAQAAPVQQVTAANRADLQYRALGSGERHRRGQCDPRPGAHPTGGTVE